MNKNRMYCEMKDGCDIFTRQYINELLTMFNHATSVGNTNHTMYTMTQYCFPGYYSERFSNSFSVFNEPGWKNTSVEQEMPAERELEYTPIDDISQEDKNRREFLELNKQRASVIRRSFCDRSSPPREAVMTIYDDDDRSSPPREAVMTIYDDDDHDDDEYCDIDDDTNGTQLEREQRVDHKDASSGNDGDKAPLLDSITDYVLPPTPESLNHESDAPSSPNTDEPLHGEPTSTIDIGSKRRCQEIDKDQKATKDAIMKCKAFVRKRRKVKDTEESSSWNISTDSDESDCENRMCDPKESIKDGKYKFTCSFCQKGFNWFSHWQAHERVHTGERPYKCKYCPRRFKRADGLHCHQIIHTKTKISHCQYCSKVFKKKECREKHLLEHTGIIPYACNYCDEKIVDTNQIELHLMKHKGKKRFTCQYCKQTLTNPKALVKHVRGHTGDKLFKCSLCPMTFNKKSALLVHHRVHSGARPYTCIQCNKTFSIKGNLRRHLVIHSGKRPYACDKCDKTYNNPSHLSRHVATQH